VSLFLMESNEAHTLKGAVITQNEAGMRWGTSTQCCVVCVWYVYYPSVEYLQRLVRPPDLALQEINRRIVLQAADNNLHDMPAYYYSIDQTRRIADSSSLS